MKNADIRLPGAGRGRYAPAPMSVLTEPCIDFKLPGRGQVGDEGYAPAGCSCPDSV